MSDRIPFRDVLAYGRNGPPPQGDKPTLPIALPDPAAELAALRERVRVQGEQIKVLREALGGMLDEFGCDTRYDNGEPRWGAKYAIDDAKKAIAATEPTP